ncbi:MAG: DUF6492 family protein, partial [Cyanobacteria bacterium P01_E01_bin.48]
MLDTTFDVVIPLYQVRWNTRAVLEGLTTHYSPRAIHVIAPERQARSLDRMSKQWHIAPLHVHPEEVFFEGVGFSKERICAELNLESSLYTPGWFYQQLLKLGAPEGIEDLSEWYVVWDSDLLPVETWPLVTEDGRYAFALIQHNGWGNASIVSKWDKWIQSVLGVEALSDRVGTFVPHHIWFKQEHLASFKQQVCRYYESTESWLLLMMRSANEFGTFSEFWAYVSWVAARAPEDLAYHPYDRYGATTERFFDDGTGKFSAALQRYQVTQSDSEVDLAAPSYAALEAFIRDEYGDEALPSSLSFESSPRHLKKGRENMHIEELRSRWHAIEGEVA